MLKDYLPTGIASMSQIQIWKDLWTFACMFSILGGLPVFWLQKGHEKT